MWRYYHRQYNLICAGCSPFSNCYTNMFCCTRDGRSKYSGADQPHSNRFRVCPASDKCDNSILASERAKETVRLVRNVIPCTKYTFLDTEET